MVVGLLKNKFIHISTAFLTIEDQCKQGYLGFGNLLFIFNNSNNKKRIKTKIPNYNSNVTILNVKVGQNLFQIPSSLHPNSAAKRRNSYRTNSVSRMNFVSLNQSLTFFFLPLIKENEIGV